tara:strand:- start:87 stop:266 length:180 start_codon:yes stop_codon:yes gene_type:complete
MAGTAVAFCAGGVMVVAFALGVVVAAIMAGGGVVFAADLMLVGSAGDNTFGASIGGDNG